MRYAAAALGLADEHIEWNEAARRVTIINPITGGRIALLIGENTAIVAYPSGNEETVILEQSAVLKDARTFVPFLVISEILDCKVDWDNTLKQVTMTKR